MQPPVFINDDLRLDCALWESFDTDGGLFLRGCGDGWWRGAEH